MPEFIPEHTPKGLDDFTRGYLEAAEWLINEDVNRSHLRGFTKAAIAKACVDCSEFFEAHRNDIEAYTEISGRPEDHAGHDFWLSRNGHGAGFFDRGDDPVFKRLQDAARAYGTCNVDVYRGWISLL